MGGLAGAGIGASQVSHSNDAVGLGAGPAIGICAVIGVVVGAVAGAVVAALR